MKLLDVIQDLEKKIKKAKITYEDYKKLHPLTKKKPNDPLFAQPSQNKPQQTKTEESVNTAYDMFKQNHPDTKLDFDKFKELRTRTQVKTSDKARPFISGAAPLDKKYLKHHLNHGSFTVLTAENPHGQKTDPEENKKRTQQLIQELQKMGVVFHKGTGHFMGNDENVFMVHHTHKVSPKDLEAIGKKYGQHSVIHSTAGHNHLKPLWEQYAGDEMKGMGHVAGNHLKKIFTDFDEAGKVKMKLSNAEKSKWHQKHYFTFAHEDGTESEVQLNFK